MGILAKNRRAAFDYKLLDKYNAGIVLTGQEVKSIKTGHISLKGSFVTLKKNEPYLTNATIPPYKYSGELKNYDSSRSRKLLLKKSEIKSLIGKIRTRGLTLVPIQVYTNKRLIKLRFAVAQGKKQYDKREDLKKKESQRKIKRSLKENF
ncbi:SsrA-binding protein SmpB [bacterium]|nr:SsrA-binding protein SmpB [bacterium]